MYGARDLSYIVGVLDRGVGLRHIAAQKIRETLIKLLEVKKKEVLIVKVEFSRKLILINLMCG